MTNLTESPENCSDLKEVVQTETIDYLKKRGREKLWLGSVAANKLQDEADRQRISQAHEARAARQAMGWDESPIEGEDDEVSNRQTVLGDFNAPTPTIVYPPTQERSPVLGTILATALAVGLPGAGVLGFAAAKYLGDKAETVIIKKGTDTSMTLGLKRIGDLDLE